MQISENIDEQIKPIETESISGLEWSALSLSFITKKGASKNTVVSTKSNIQIEKNAIGKRKKCIDL